MKIFDYKTMRWLQFLAVVLLLNACTDDAPGDQEKNSVLLELRPYAPSFLEVEPIQTRAFPGDYGYYEYGDEHVNGQFSLQSSLQKAAIHMLFFKDTDGSLEEGTFYKSGDSWRSRVEMATDAYYLYGFIPDGVVDNISFPVDNDFRKGITFRIKNLNSITPNDVCVCVAAGRGGEAGPDTDFGIGKFRYQARQSEEKNYVYLLFDHIYASICFSFKVDAESEYSKLRYIKLKKLRMLSSAMPKSVDATVTLYPNANGLNPLESGSVSFVGSSGSATVDGTGEKDGLLFDATEGDATPVTITTTPSNFLGCFVPGNYESFTLESTFDVYDMDDNRVRKDCVATNSIKLQKILSYGTWGRGVMLKLNLTVRPTYLYMLSEPDLDNPTVVEN